MFLCCFYQRSEISGYAFFLRRPWMWTDFRDPKITLESHRKGLDIKPLSLIVIFSFASHSNIFIDCLCMCFGEMGQVFFSPFLTPSNEIFSSIYYNFLITLFSIIWCVHMLIEMLLMALLLVIVHLLFFSVYLVWLWAMLLDSSFLVKVLLHKRNEMDTWVHFNLVHLKETLEKWVCPTYLYPKI